MEPTATRAVLARCDDRALAERAAAGSVAAFAVLYERHHRDVERCCRGVLRDGEEAQDAAQSALLKALASLRRDGAPDSVAAWLARIARNEAVSALRRRRDALAMADVEVREGAPTSGAELPARPAPAAEHEALARETVRELLGDLRALPARQRGALLMRAVHGLEYAQIAACLDTSSGAARQDVHAARDNLREMSAGRAMRCDGVRTAIAAGDRRRLRAYRLRAHLLWCAECGAAAGRAAAPRGIAALPGLAAAWIGRLASALGGAEPLGALGLTASGALRTAAVAGVLVAGGNAAGQTGAVQGLAGERVAAVLLPPGSATGGPRAAPAAPRPRVRPPGAASMAGPPGPVRTATGTVPGAAFTTVAGRTTHDTRVGERPASVGPAESRTGAWAPRLSPEPRAGRAARTGRRIPVRRPATGPGPGARAAWKADRPQAGSLPAEGRPAPDEGAPAPKEGGPPPATGAPDLRDARPSGAARSADAA